MTPVPNKPAILLIFALAALGFGAAAWIKYGKAQQPPAQPLTLEQIFRMDPRGKIEEPCPPDALTFFVIGQSHAANSMLPRTSAENNPHLLNYFKGKCYRLSDPILGPADFRGSLWPVFAQALYPHVNKPVVIMSYALNGTSAQEWLPGEEGVGLMERALAEARRYTQADGTIEYIIYDQGQRDAMDLTPKEIYAQHLKTIFDHLQNEITGDQTFLMYGQSWCTAYNPPVPYIIEAQQEFAAARPDTVMVMNMDDLDDTYRHDDCHFNGKGRAVIAQKLVEAVLKKEQKN
ncbi:MAG: hypothetical protein IPH06_06950 [Alphaproteobacteria bacterium]|nr:hypothetical protein [Alphaproteobacteria bacterium]QQS57753.1 MAG: hypothetical protein IPN28_02715 [Alphaproteobacteria bacterium]